jgi:hypothetical protein
LPAPVTQPPRPPRTSTQAYGSNGASRATDSRGLFRVVHALAAANSGISPLSRAATPNNPREIVVNPTRTIRRLGRFLAGLAATLLASTATTSAAFAAASRGPAGAPAAPAATPPVFRAPPGWNKHPPLPDPSRIHAALLGGMPGWQIALIAAGAAILAVTLAVLLTRARAARRRAAASPA